MCPTTESVNTYILRIHILTNIINMRGESGHRGKRANPVCGVPLTLKMVITHILVLLRGFLAETTSLESSLNSMYGEAILPPEK